MWFPTWWFHPYLSRFFLWHYSNYMNSSVPVKQPWASIHKAIKTSYRQISWSVKATKLHVILILSLWNLTGISASLLPRCLSNFKAIWKIWTRGFEASRDLAARSCVRLVNRGPGGYTMLSIKYNHDISWFSFSSNLKMYISEMRSLWKFTVWAKCHIACIL